MKNKRIVGLMMSLSYLTLSCEQREYISPSSTKIEIENPKASLQAAFAKALAKAIQEDSELRSFIKNKATKKFDKDYDVLYQMVKDEPIHNGATFHERLKKYMDLNSQLELIEQELPLLTIFIPTLPSGFSPESWQVETEIPSVATSMDGSNDVPFYDATGKRNVIKPGEIPGFPIIVIKQNERVAVGEINNASNESSNLQFYNKGIFTFRFANKAYDGIHQVASRGAYDPRESYPPGTNVPMLDPVNVDAWRISNSSGNANNPPWQRDYVYYGIEPSVPNGTLRRVFRETLRSIKFSEAALYRMADQSGAGLGDPTYRDGTPYWTEGEFEFRMTVLYGAKNGTGADIPRIFTARLEDLYAITYSRYRANRFDDYYYSINTVTPKEFHPETEIITWDLENFGDTWRFQFHEEDSSVESTVTTQVTSTYSENFEFNAMAGNEKLKIGAKFGTSNTQQLTQTVSYKITQGSDDLGASTLSFDQPVIIGTEMQWFTEPDGGQVLRFKYLTHEITGGGAAGLYFGSVEPVRYF
ncbi:hypothetical protein [Hymenobacter sp.]|jgi:hypothetical protein|uniref:hypothetical protein n=1 Tax=Hymenobacter sp. TaxID=1898978 RepID=UPI002ED80A2C